MEKRGSTKHCFVAISVAIYLRDPQCLCVCVNVAEVQKLTCSAASKRGDRDLGKATGLAEGLRPAAGGNHIAHKYMLRYISPLTDLHPDKSHQETE